MVEEREMPSVFVAMALFFLTLQLTLAHSQSLPTHATGSPRLTAYTVPLSLSPPCAAQVPSGSVKMFQITRFLPPLLCLLLVFTHPLV